jgi:glycerol kinase
MGTGVLTALGWTHAGVPAYAIEGIIISSASTLTWLRDHLGLASDVPALEKLAKDAGDNGGVYLVPAFTGLGLPHWRPDAHAAITGLRAHSDRRQVARAAFESIAFQIRDALEAMRAEAGVPLVALHADGGPSASKFLMQLTADITGTELRVPTMPDCSALGAVLSGQLGLGTHADLSAIELLPRDEVVFRPSMDAARVSSLVAGWDPAKFIRLTRSDESQASRSRQDALNTTSRK